MPDEMVMERSNEGDGGKSGNQQPSPYLPHKELFAYTSPRSPLSTHSPETDSIDLAMDVAIETSIDQLYNNVCEMQSSDQSPSRFSFVSYGQESRIDSELRFLAGGDFWKLELSNEAVAKEEGDGGNGGRKIERGHSAATAKSFSTLKLPRPSPRRKSFGDNNKPPTGKKKGRSLKKLNASFPLKSVGNSASEGAAYLGPYLLKQTREMVSSGENPKKAIELALRALKSFENCEDGKPNLEYVMCLHLVAALYCSMGQYTEAIPLLERSIEVPAMDEGPTHSLAKFAGCMQLGDTYAMLGQIENSLLLYTAGLEIQRQALGENDPRFGETCRYVSEAHVQAMQFDEAEKLCQMALDVHREKGSLEETADRRLMGLICDAKGNYKNALEHYALASMAMAANGQESDVAAIDCNIGDAYLSLARYDEAIFAYQKAISSFKSKKGENHTSVALVFVRLASLYNKIGKFRDSKSHCKNALQIYLKPMTGSPQEEIASGLVEISAIYESMNELGKALKLLKRAWKTYENLPGQQCTVAGIEAQMGVLHYMMGDYEDSYDALKDAVLKFRAGGEKRSALFGIALNQMGLACVQIYKLTEAAELFKEARSVLEAECGSYHLDTLGVYSNLAGTYDALGRCDDAIEILEYVVGMREDKLGTANPDVDDERHRLAELLKEAGRARSKRTRSLETLLNAKSRILAAKDGS